MQAKGIVLLSMVFLTACHQAHEKRMYELAAMNCILGNVVFDRDPETGTYGPTYLFGCPDGKKETVRRGK